MPTTRRSSWSNEPSARCASAKRPLRPKTEVFAASSSSRDVAAAIAARPRVALFLEDRAGFVGVHRPPSLATSLCQPGARERDVQMERQPAVGDVRPGATALRLGHAARHEQADLAARARARPARREQRLGVARS